MLMEQLNALVSDLTSTETAVAVDQAVLAYTKTEIEADSLSWLPTLPDSELSSVLKLHLSQTVAAQKCKLAVLSLIASLT